MRGLSIVVLASLSAGCTVVGEDYVAPELALEESWAAATEAGFVAQPAEDLGVWWQVYGDERLNALVEEALAGNLDLATAVARVQQAAAVRGQAVGNRYPDFDGTGGFTRNRFGENGFPELADAQTYDSYSVGLDVAWEIDLWGRVTRLIEAADADLDASVEDMRDVRALLVAEVVAAYVDLRTAQALVAVTLENVETQRASLEITQTRFDNGAAPLLDVAQADRNLANTESELPSFVADKRDAELRLAVLTGAQPAALVDALEGGAIPAPPPSIRVGVPANAVRQRPDVRGAERRLAREVAQLGVEIGDLYPRFILGGSLGYEARSSGDLLDRASGVFGLGPSFDWNLFDGGRERGEVRAQRFAIEAAHQEYRQTALLALEEAESALFGLARARERQTILARAVEASRRSAELSKVLYLEGRSDFQNVLDAERSLFEAQEGLISGTADVAQSYVSLQRALGGGWQASADDGAAVE